MIFILVVRSAHGELLDSGWRLVQATTTIFNSVADRPYADKQLLLPVLFLCTIRWQYRKT